jgi:RNA polymerase sigma-70 factor (ECF subfamily)
VKYDALYREHAKHVWGVCYRMTGSASDADDLVQETFERAMSRPPARAREPWRPWLVKVAVNLARDQLRRRKRAPYDGPWLPAPIETDDDAAPDCDLERRYGLLESVSFAFLVAVEALTPRQRAVLLLREVLEYSVKETASALELSEANVKTTHHRARAAMESYDRARSVPTRDLQEKTRTALERFTASLVAGDAAAIEALLAPDARTMNDSGGEFHAARRVIAGANKVMRFYLGLMRKLHAQGGQSASVRMLNGLPAVVIDWEGAPNGFAPRSVLRCEIDGAGLITTVHLVVATSKLSALMS